MALAMPPLSSMMVHALPPSHAGVSSGLNSTTRELGSAIGVAVLSTILTRFADHLPAALSHVPGSGGTAIRHSVTTAIAYASRESDPVVRARLLGATHAAFISGTSLGLRVGAALVLLMTAVVFHQCPNEQRG
jgi:hypothetical protein